MLRLEWSPISQHQSPPNHHSPVHRKRPLISPPPVPPRVHRIHRPRPHQNNHQKILPQIHHLTQVQFPLLTLPLIHHLNQLQFPLLTPRQLHHLNQLQSPLLTPLLIQHWSQVQFQLLIRHPLQLLLPLHHHHRSHPVKNRQMCLTLPRSQRMFPPSSQHVKKTVTSTYVLPLICRARFAMMALVVSVQNVHRLLHATQVARGQPFVAQTSPT
mmetsp:Transcript_17014/g.36664  ORF Transcript_17014/g.36664 Transcript_17014/m.36664 type:complete len:213 (+) Transcript_17014:2578-3216(+)